jgi:hypothetical protein
VSGGSYDYAYCKIDELASAVEQRARDPQCKGRNLRLAFARHLRKVAKAAHELEWADSGDTGWPDPVQWIRAVVTPADEIAAATDNARAALADLQAALAEVPK